MSMFFVKYYNKVLTLFHQINFLEDICYKIWGTEELWMAKYQPKVAPMGFTKLALSPTLGPWTVLIIYGPKT